MQFSDEILAFFRERWKADKFIKRLRQLLKENNIKEIELAKVIGVNDQTISNWFSNNGATKPQWIEYMYKLNIYLFTKIEDYSPMDLYFDFSTLAKGVKEYDIKIEQEERKKKIAQQKLFYEILSTINNKLSKGIIYDINFSNLLANDNFYKTIADINEKYCKLPPNERNKGYGPNSVNKLKDSLFDVVCKFLDNENKKNKNNL